MNQICTDNTNYLREAEAYHERLHIALKAAKICVFEVDIVNQLYTFFENAEDIFGVSGDIILEDVRPFSQLSPAEYQQAASDYFAHPDDADIIAEAFKCILAGKATTYQARMKAGGSDYIWCKLDVSPIMENGVPTRMIGVITDISQLKSKTEELEHQAKLDDFTGLYHKSSAMELIQKSLIENPKTTQALVLLDIDNFKKYNDTFGHDEGDHIIRLVASCLQSAFGSTDIIGRFGGDEFILHIKEIKDVFHMEVITEKLENMTRCTDGNLSCTNSLGVALYPQDAADFVALFQKADQALYHAKSIKEKCTLYSDYKK